MSLEMGAQHTSVGAASTSDVPMTRPEELLASHDNFVRKAAFVQLDSGRILAARGEFAYSDDKGLTWCEPFQAKSTDGDAIGMTNLIKLEKGLIGGVQGNGY